MTRAQLLCKTGKLQPPDDAARPWPTFKCVTAPNFTLLFYVFFFILHPQILPTSVQHFKQDDRPDAHVSLLVSSLNLPGSTSFSLQWQTHTVASMLKAHFISAVCKSLGMSRSLPSRVQVVPDEYVTKGTVAIHACCCANRRSMWSLEIAAVQWHRVYRACLCFQVQNPSWVPHQPYIMQHPVRRKSPTPSSPLSLSAAVTRAKDFFLSTDRHNMLE